MKFSTLRLPFAVFFALCLLFTGVSPLRADPGSGTALKALLKNVRTFTLSNGMRVIMYRRGTAPVFTGAVVVRVGGVDEEPGSTGIAHMLEHMAFKGTATIGTRDYGRERALLDELEQLMSRVAAGAELSAAEVERRSEIEAELSKLWILGEFTQEYERRGGNGLNATTDVELTKYFVNMPGNQLEFWAWIESERMMRPVMRQFYQERDVVLEERRMRSEDDPSGKLYENLLGAVFRVHPYRNPVIGYAQDIARLTASQVEEFHRRFYVPANMVVALVGDVEPERDIEVIRRYFERVPAGKAPELPKIVDPEQEGERTVAVELDSSPEAAVIFKVPNYPHPDSAPLTLMAEYLGGSRTSPLYEVLVKQEKVATAVEYMEGPGDAYPGMLLYYFKTRSPHTNQEVLRLFESVLERFLEKGLTQADLDVIKRRLGVMYLGQLQSNSSLALDLASSEALFGDWRMSVNWYEDAMQVTPDEVLRVARRYLRPRNRTVARIERKA